MYVFVGKHVRLFGKTRTCFFKDICGVGKYKKSLSSQGGSFYVMPEITNKNFPTLRC